jgi:hypothetical protein
METLQMGLIEVELGSHKGLKKLVTSSIETYVVSSDYLYIPAVFCSPQRYPPADSWFLQPDHFSLLTAIGGSGVNSQSQHMLFSGPSGLVKHPLHMQSGQRRKASTPIQQILLSRLVGARCEGRRGVFWVVMQNYLTLTMFTWIHTFIL